MITVQEMIRFSCNTVVYMDNELASSESQAHLFFYREINKFNSSFHRVAAMVEELVRTGGFQTCSRFACMV